ncbi:type II methionyl aminopeptidase [Candidatus Protochlamydia sp. W-9]|uniref:type II methionyl aminopeptidase n=1 Tax=Candidatus Protochlamydia sp. W-9 TaxID=1785087 RepID=UPI00096A4454|nr:type II methionyl aminopeptidase [Candidatus Protochlamydia sp. W-9]
MQQIYKQNFIRAGELAGQVRAYGKSLIKKGASYKDVMDKISAKIFDLGAKPAFPPQMALNHVAAHYLIYPGEDVIFSDQVIKLDVGVCYKGAIGDCAVTVDLSDKYQKLIQAVEEALLNAEQIVKVGLPVREIGYTIDQTISSYGFKAVKNLSGHGLGPHKIHTSPIIPNYDNHSKAVIKPGMTFAIEPFATDGEGLIYEEGKATIFAFTSWRPVRSEIARLVLNKVKTFNGLPFSIHNLLDAQFSLLELETGLAELLRFGVIAEYGPLIEEKNGIVAQAENSVLVDEHGKVFITTRL